ncbi:MAG TPA: FAD-dependent monooxygenase [Vicinamibacterales bacterium]|nr:FAD-dependent monooxygenase [Vicinamibacterales bacterium]
MQKPVLVVGGGIGGLALAIALKRARIPVEIWERVPAYKPVGAGIALAINGMAVLRALGAGARVEARGGVIQRFRITDQHDRVIGAVDLTATAREHGPSIAIHRGALHEALVAAVADIPFRAGLSVQSLEAHAEGVRVESTAGDRGDYAVVVGADGIRSRVRELAFGAIEPIYAGYTSWRLVLDNHDSLTDSTEMWGHGRRVGLVPIGGGQIYIFTTMNQPRLVVDAAPDRVARFKQNFGAFSGPFQRLLTQITDADQLLHNDIEEVWLDRWHRGRVVLLGDAAHAMTPNTGQGAGMALEDAWVLARELARAPTVGHALQTYERIRIPRVRAIHRASRLLGRVAQWEHPAACALRNAIFRAIPSRAQLRGMKKLIEDGAALLRE